MNCILPHCFPSSADFKEQYGYRFQVAAMYERVGHIPKITCLINLNSPDDMQAQAIPFIRALEALSERARIPLDEPVELRFYAGPAGHQPMDTVATIALLRKVLNEIKPTQEHSYQKEYKRLMQFRSIRLLLWVKKLLGKPYSPKYIK